MRCYILQDMFFVVICESFLLHAASSAKTAIENPGEDTSVAAM